MCKLLCLRHSSREQENSSKEGKLKTHKDCFEIKLTTRLGKQLTRLSRQQVEPTHKHNGKRNSRIKVQKLKSSIGGVCVRERGAAETVRPFFEIKKTHTQLNAPLLSPANEFRVQEDSAQQSYLASPRLLLRVLITKTFSRLLITPIRGATFLRLPSLPPPALSFLRFFFFLFFSKFIILYPLLPASHPSRRSQAGL